jgi:hypothetical protein
MNEECMQLNNYVIFLSLSPDCCWPKDRVLSITILNSRSGIRRTNDISLNQKVTNLINLVLEQDFKHLDFF